MTILIPAHNRTEHLLTTLKTIIPLISGNVVILVVDDASSGNAIAEACAPFHPKVSYVRTPRNLGVIGARNFGLSLVETEFLVHLDDDSHFTSAQFILNTIDYFRTNPNVAVLSYNILAPDREPRVSVGTKPFLSRAYVGCGNAWRMSAIQQVGGFYEGFWRQGEEVEHGMRVYDAGYTILAVPDMLVQHDESPLHRDPRKHLSLEAANYLKRIALRVPAPYLPQMLLRWLAFVARYHNKLSFRQIATELLHPERSFAQTVRQRTPIRASTFQFVERLKRDEAALIRGGKLA